MWDTSSPAQATSLRDDHSMVLAMGGREAERITGFPAVEEGQLLLQHRLEHQLLDAAVDPGRRDVVQEVTGQLQQSTGTSKEQVGTAVC